MLMQSKSIKFLEIRYRKSQKYLESLWNSRKFVEFWLFVIIAAIFGNAKLERLAYILFLENYSLEQNNSQNTALHVGEVFRRISRKHKIAFSLGFYEKLLIIMIKN